MTTNSNNISAPDLTKRPPRSPRIRLGGYVLLPRMLDKGRAEIAGQSGDYHYNCPLDQHFVNFVGIDPAALRKELAAGKGDGEILNWVNETAQFKRTPGRSSNGANTCSGAVRIATRNRCNISRT